MTRSRLGLGIWVLGFAMLAAGTAGCAKARAETVPDGPPLATPAPPPRVLAPVEDVLATVPPIFETPTAPTASPPATQKPTTARRPSPAPDTQKPPEPPPAQPPPAVAETPVRQPAPNPAEEKKITDALARATRDLGNVNYQNLTVDGKAQYDEAKNFQKLAEAEIKVRNYPY